MASTGTLSSLWRYPVKSMIGEEIVATPITERGVLGDRAYALIDQATGKLGSAKNPKTWPAMFQFHSRYIEPPVLGAPLPPVQIQLPDGAHARSDQPDASSVLSKAIGRDVTLSALAPEKTILEEYWPDIEGLDHREAVTDEDIGALAPGTFFDAAAIHLVTTSTLDALRQAYPPGRFEVRRFRPNFVVETGEQGFVENEWVGKDVAIGSEVVLQVVIPCPRCVMTTLEQSDLPHDSGILRTAARTNSVQVGTLGIKPSVGVYAVVRTPGTVRRGDSVTVL